MFVVTVASALIVAGTPSAAYADTGEGSITVTVSTPDGVAANVEINGASHRMASKEAHGTSQTKTLHVPAGKYTITPDVALYHARQYFGVASPQSVIVQSGQNATVTVTYAGEPTAASNFRLTAFSGSSLSFAWDADGNGPYALRRAPGKRAPVSPKDGSKVSADGNTAIDDGLTPGKTYSYSLFTMVRGSWVGPLALTLSTTPPAGSTSAAYVTAPGTLLASDDDIAQEFTTGDGVLVTFTAAVAVPQVGSAVVLPVSEVLKGGYVGAVVSIADDGRTALLRASSIDAAFVYYSLNVPTFSSGDVPLAPSQASTSKPAYASKASIPSCFGGSSDFSVSFDPKVALHGSFNATITHGWLNIPDGATMSASLGATVRAVLGVKAEDAVTCKAPLNRFDYPVAVEPVPITFDFEPIVQLSLGGGVDIDAIGMDVTAGVTFSTDFGPHGVSLSSQPFANGSVLEPKVTKSAGLQAQLGGDLTFGPGAATEEAGVVAGVSGTLNPIKGSFGPVSTETGQASSTCLLAELGGDAALGLKAKAWLGQFDASQSFTLWHDSWTYGSWHFPSNCEGSEPPTDPGQSVLGPGVTKVSDSTTGAPTQMGYVAGLVPGQNTWLLSSGNVSDAVGSPGGFASTDLGLPGDSTLSALSGQPTYDAATYQVTLIPTGSTLHVKYAFASEEYPEFVGSAFNDVMAVTVDGVNCATVPGTSTPVSINTINDHTHAQYYVDNATGAAGYNTKYDGLTVPLTCDVPVTPGHQVTVRIAVADASDHIYDSGVALLDKGIWSD
jgi:hypothetical protein